MRRQIKGATCGHIWHTHLLHVATTGSILLSQGCRCTFWQLVVEWVYSSTVKKFTTAAQRNGIHVFADQFSPVPTRRGTSTTAKASHKFFWLFIQWHSVYLVRWTTHGWTDTTASQQVANTLTDNNFWLTKWLIQDSARTSLYSKSCCHHCQRNWEAGRPTARSNHCFLIASFWEWLGT